MQPLLEKYNAVYLKIKSIRDRILDAEAAAQRIENKHEVDVPARVKRLQEQIEKVDEYLLKIGGFKKEVEKYLTSKNVQTIEAPAGYRVNLNRLRRWAMMIDPQSVDDPYAQRVNFVARCDELFLNKKKKEFEERIESLTTGNADEMDKNLREARAKIPPLKEELAAFAASEEMAAFAEAVVQANKEFWYESESSLPEVFNLEKPGRQHYIAPGAYALPLEFEKEQRGLLAAKFGRLYDEANSRILLPFTLEKGKEFAIQLSCFPAKTRELDRGLQNMLLDIVNKNPAGSHKIYVIDAVRFSSASLGFLRQLENTFAIEQLPRNPEQVSATLEQIVSSFSDMDEMLELSDSVNEYNETCAPGKEIPKTIIVLFGYPNAFDGRDREYIQRIMTNYERYGISFISVKYGREVNKDIAKGLPDYAALSAIYINMMPKETTVSVAGETPFGFTWYVLRNELPAAYIDSIKNIKIEKRAKGNLYTQRYNVTSVPVYERRYKDIDLPFGVDGKDRTQSVKFENENFATYLVGASRSGKSTLLHTLIAGLIRDYHPDHVELWLADFKQLEFKLYIEHCPPHVKYVLLDESVELVYDLIDRLTEEMMERQRIFARQGVDKLSKINYAELDKPLPVIFVILDEFSIMSQAIAESQFYRLRLQNLLAKGAALGIRFLFASQTFTQGIAGLTPPAKAQIQQRIAMKASREEIGETLELSSNLKTEQVRNWMDALPPHYALVKYRPGEDAMPQVMRVHVLFFPPEERDAMIDGIITRFKPVDGYVPHDPNVFTYVDKKPVLVDGNTYEAFDKLVFTDYITSLKAQDKGTYTCHETFMSLGTPRLMTRIKPIAITQEARENLLLVGRSVEQACAAAIISSAIQSYLAQGRKVQVWVYDKNRMFQAYKNAPWSDGEYAPVVFKEGIHAICNAIYETKEKIRNKQQSNELIIMIGMDRICADFEFIDGDASSTGMSAEAIHKATDEELKRSGVTVETRIDELKRETAVEWEKLSAEIETKANAEGKTTDELAALLKEAKTALYSEKRALMIKLQAEASEKPGAKPIGGEAATPQSASGGAEPPHRTSASSRAESPHSVSGETASPHSIRVEGEYNAAADFQHIVRQGSRSGYHFLLHINNLADLKQTGLKLDAFRHRLAFTIADEDSRELFGNRNASSLPEHVCQYYDSLERFSFRPYLHKGIGWEGWEVNADGEAVSPFTN